MSSKENIPRALAEKFNDVSWGGLQLRGIALFKQFSDSELIDLYARGEIRPVTQGSSAVIEGEQSRGLFIIFHGALSVHKNNIATGTMHRIAYLDQGTSFGEMSLLDRASRSVIGETDCFLFHLDASVFENFLEAAGDNLKSRFYKTCAEDLSERFRAINSDYITSQQLLWKYALRRSDDELPKAKAASASVNR